VEDKLKDLMFSMGNANMNIILEEMKNQKIRDYKLKIKECQLRIQEYSKCLEEMQK